MKLKNWIFKNKINLILSLIGGIAGFSYWYFVGCATGNCGITASWNTSTGYGLIMGWLVGSLIKDQFKSVKK